MPKFSIKDLLISTAIVAIGLAAIGFSLSYRPQVENARSATPYLAATYLAGCTVTGAGILRLVSRAVLGAIVGFIAGFLYFVFVAS